MFDTLIAFIIDALWSCVAALGFAVLFNVPRRMLLGCALVGAVGHAARFLVLHAGLPIEAATLFAAVLVGGLSAILSRIYQTPALIFGIVGAIPMVPGVFAYRAMIGLIRVAGADTLLADERALLLSGAAINAVKTGLLLGALAVGIAVPTLLFSRRKPVV
ncbi:MAG: threonine/serine exporter family protein [Chloroflexota bacterium]|nr:threonine/serine exporter family protein [Chloroflexota bacterium]